MGEYANLQVWKNLDNAKGSVFEEYYNLMQQGVEHSDIYEKLNLDIWKFGSLRFTTFEDQLYYLHESMDLLTREDTVLQWKYDIPAAWLLAFSFPEFKASSAEGSEEDPAFGLFNARTTGKNAMQRMASIPYEAVAKTEKQNLIREVERLGMLLAFTDDEDMLTISSGMIYYSTDGKFDEDYVKKEINEKVKSVLEVLHVPHWKQLSSQKD